MFNRSWNTTIKALLMLAATCFLIQPVGAQFTEDEEVLSERFVKKLTSQVNGYIITASHDENFLQWLIGLNEYHDIQRARWQIQNLMVKTKALQMVKPWRYSDDMDVYITELLFHEKILLTVSFSPHLNGFVVLSHGQVEVKG